MGGGSTTTNTTQQSASQTQLPPWVNQAAEQNYGFAQNVANQPLVQYQGQMVASPGQQMGQAWNLAAQSGGAGQPQYAESEAAYLNAAGGPTLATTNLQPYMNPYTQGVINTTLPLMQQQLAQTQSGIGGQAAQASAFGGSRMGVQQGVAQAQGALNMANLNAQLQSANVTNAQNQAQQDLTRSAQSQIQAGTGLGQLGQQAQMNQARQFSELVTAGSLEQQQAQNQINAQMAKFQQAYQYPQQQLGTLLSALGMTPYGQQTQGYSTGTTTQQSSPNYMSAALGGLQTLGGLFGSGGPFGASGALAGLFSSDRHLKTDITRIDTHPSGLPIYAYRYKGDPKTYPKVMGPMAEDVMKIAPHAVRPLGVGGRLGVNMQALDALAPPPGPMPVPGVNRGVAGPISPTVNPPGLPPSPRIPTGGARGAPMGGGPVPGALSGSVPMGTIGALGANMRTPRIRPPRLPRPMMGGGKGALAIGG